MDEAVYELIQPHAWSLNDSHNIVVNVLEHIGAATSNTEAAITVVFPECGSGYHEWRVVHALKHAGYKVGTVVLMDSHVQPAWTDAWRCIALLYDVELVVLDSYMAIEQWSRSCSSDVFVFYINGALRFGTCYCGLVNPSACQMYAVRFWGWCERVASNRIPLNFVGGSVFKLALCNTWFELATVFTQ
jgi:hypothetical protein